MNAHNPQRVRVSGSSNLTTVHTLERREECRDSQTRNNRKSYVHIIHAYTCLSLILPLSRFHTALKNGSTCVCLFQQTNNKKKRGKKRFLRDLRALERNQKIQRTNRFVHFIPAHHSSTQRAHQRQQRMHGIRVLLVDGWVFVCCSS